jgi:hypothetical protein
VRFVLVDEVVPDKKTPPKIVEKIQEKMGV